MTLPSHPDELSRDSLADLLARRIGALIQTGRYRVGDRLPAIGAMARGFGVGAPTVREAITKLETLGIVDVRHGSGVYVASRRGRLVLARPQLGGAFDATLLADLVAVRIPLEIAAVEAVGAHGSAEDLAALRDLVHLGNGVTDEPRLASMDTAFHQRLAAISGNTVLAQILDALRDLSGGDERAGDWQPLVRDWDVRAHASIVEALEARDAPLAADRMRAHLQQVRDAVVALCEIRHGA